MIKYGIYTYVLQLEILSFFMHGHSFMTRMFQPHHTKYDSAYLPVSNAYHTILPGLK